MPPQSGQPAAWRRRSAATGRPGRPGAPPGSSRTGTGGHRGPVVGGVQRAVVARRSISGRRPPSCAGGTGGWCRPGSPAPTYSLKPGVSDRTARPRPAISCWVRERLGGPPGTEGEEHMLARRPAPARSPPGTGTARPRPPCRAGRCRPHRSRRPARQAAARAGRARPARHRYRRCPPPAGAIQSSTAAIGVDHGQPRGSAGLPAQRGEAGDRDATSGRRRRAARSAGQPARRPGASASTRRILVSTVQCVWSSSGLACGRAVGRRGQLGQSAPPARFRDGHAAAAAAGQRRAASPGWPPPSRVAARRGQPRPAWTVSTTPRLRSSLQTAVDDRHRQLGQPADLRGRRPARLRRWPAARRGRPASPSARPTAAATSATTASTSIAMVIVPLPFGARGQRAGRYGGPSASQAGRRPYGILPHHAGDSTATGPPAVHRAAPARGRTPPKMLYAVDAPCTPGVAGHRPGPS